MFSVDSPLPLESDKLIPVDVYLRLSAAPEAIIDAIIKLRKENI